MTGDALQEFMSRLLRPGSSMETVALGGCAPVGPGVVPAKVNSVRIVPDNAKVTCAQPSPTSPGRSFSSRFSSSSSSETMPSMPLQRSRSARAQHEKEDEAHVDDAPLRMPLRRSTSMPVERRRRPQLSASVSSSRWYDAASTALRSFSDGELDVSVADSPDRYVDVDGVNALRRRRQQQTQREQELLPASPPMQPRKRLDALPVCPLPLPSPLPRTARQPCRPEQRRRPRMPPTNTPASPSPRFVSSSSRWESTKTSFVPTRDSLTAPARKLRNSSIEGPKVGGSRRCGVEASTAAVVESAVSIVASTTAAASAATTVTSSFGTSPSSATERLGVSLHHPPFPRRLRELPY